jgi:hypothetical protein
MSPLVTTLGAPSGRSSPSVTTSTPVTANRVVTAKTAAAQALSPLSLVSQVCTHAHEGIERYRASIETSGDSSDTYDREGWSSHKTRIGKRGGKDLNVTNTAITSGSASPPSRIAAIRYDCRHSLRSSVAGRGITRYRNGYSPHRKTSHAIPSVNARPSIDDNHCTFQASPDVALTSEGISRARSLMNFNSLGSRRARYCRSPMLSPRYWPGSKHKSKIEGAGGKNRARSIYRPAIHFSRPVSENFRLQCCRR